MDRVQQIKLHPSVLYNDMAICIAYCIGATYDNAEQTANTITNNEIEACIDSIREIMTKSDYIKTLT